MWACPTIQSVFETIALTLRRRVHRALEAGQEVEDRARHQELDRDVVLQLVPLALHRREEVPDEAPDRDHEHDGEEDRDRLQPLADGPVEHVVRAGPDVDEGERPEADHREPVGVERRLGGLRDEVVADPEAERREDEADRVVDVEPVQVRLVRARREHRREVPDDVDERRSRGSPPMMYQIETYICWYLRVTTVMTMFRPNITHAIVTRTSRTNGSSAYSRPCVHAARERHDGAEDDRDPEAQRRHPELLAPELDAAEARDQVEAEPHVGGEEPAEEHPVDVQRAACARTCSQEMFPRSVGMLQLAGDDQGDEARDHEEERGHEDEAEGGPVLVLETLGRAAWSGRGRDAAHVAHLPAVLRISATFAGSLFGAGRVRLTM